MAPKTKGKKTHHHPDAVLVPKTDWSVWFHAHPWVTAGLLNVFLALAVYYSALLSPTLIENEESILQVPVLSHVKNISHIFTEDFLLFTEGKFRPLSYALLTLPRTFIAADSVLFWHLWLLGFHILNACLLFGLARQFTTRLLPPLFLSIAFTLHPLSSVLVNDINQFYIILGLTMVLGSLNFYTHFTQSGNRWSYAGAILFCFLALFTAQMAFALPLILLVYELGFRRERLGQTSLRLLPFVLMPLCVLPFFNVLTPHPLHFKYVQTHEGSFWHGIFSITGASGIYAMAFLWGSHLVDFDGTIRDQPQDHHEDPQPTPNFFADSPEG